MDETITLDSEEFDLEKYQKNFKENNFDTTESEGKGVDR